jgi:hypothetical protein
VTCAGPFGDSAVREPGAVMVMSTPVAPSSASFVDPAGVGTDDAGSTVR